jgi:hypothetical protein
VAIIVKVERFTIEGVPDRTPDDVRFSPGGKLPAATEKTAPGTVVEKEYVYGTPTVAAGGEPAVKPIPATWMFIGSRNNPFPTPLVSAIMKDADVPTADAGGVAESVAVPLVWLFRETQAGGGAPRQQRAKDGSGSPVAATVYVLGTPATKVV